MKRVRINQGFTGLVFRNGDYQRVLTAGKHWIGLKEDVRAYNMSLPFNTNLPLNLLLRDEALADMLHVVNLKDQEIALVFESGNFQNTLTAGKHVYWKGLMDYRFQVVNLNEVFVDKDIPKEVLSKASLLKYIRVYKVEPYETGLLFVDGVYTGKLKTGTHYFWKNNTPVEVFKADMRQMQMEISGQEILTKDKAAIRINFYTQYKIIDVEKALIENKDFAKQLYILLQLALREYIGTLSLDELLEKKEAIKGFVLNSIEEQISNLGVKITDAGIRDIILPGDMKEIMNQVLIAQKKAQANTIMRREETASTRTLLNTAKLMEENDILFKLKEMEYVEKIADKIGEITVSGNGQIIDQLKGIFSGK